LCFSPPERSHAKELEQIARETKDALRRALADAATRQQESSDAALRAALDAAESRHREAMQQAAAA
jgi:hypothetical protein